VSADVYFRFSANEPVRLSGQYGRIWPKAERQPWSERSRKPAVRSA
jgi:hypothetical protein